MPGFLGTEKQFYEKFGRPIIMSRDAKSSSREQEAGEHLQEIKVQSGISVGLVATCEPLCD